MQPKASREKVGLRLEIDVGKGTSFCSSSSIQVVFCPLRMALGWSGGGCLLCCWWDCL